MKIDKPQNSNYCAIVVELKNIIPFASCENVVGTSIFGMTAVIGKEHKVGDIGIVFPAETQQLTSTMNSLANKKNYVLYAMSHFHQNS